ncbi:MAG: zinc ribbon domain-containing protein [Candidatus Woesearchaeota archaeon]
MGVSGILYIIFGIFIGIISRIIYTANHKMVFLIFFWIGILFIIVGAFKLVMKKYNQKNDEIVKKYIENGRNIEMERKIASAKRTQPYQQHKITQQYQISHPQRGYQVAHQQQSNQPNYVTCFRCGTKNHVNANFCNYCGNKIR